MRKYLAITGMMGAGKSTLAQQLHAKLGWQLLAEGAIEQRNLFFADAYADFTRWGFHSQAEFLVGSAERHAKLALELTHGDTTVVEDYTPFEHSGAYLPAYVSVRGMAGRELDVLVRLTQLIEPLYLVPDLLVFRRVDRDQIAERLHIRSRPGEEGVDADITRAVHEHFDEFVSRWTKCPVLVVESDVDLFVRSAAEATVSRINDAINGLSS